MTENTALHTAFPDRVRRPIRAPGSGAGRLVAVCGTGGTGASTLALALAQSLARRDVLLVDTALDADQALFHGTRDDAPSIAELVAAHHHGAPASSQVRANTTAFPDRGYRFLPGLRSHADRVTLRRADVIAAALTGLRDTFELVVADTDAAVGSTGDRSEVARGGPNLLARGVLASADSVMVVTAPGLKGLHTLARCIQRLIDFGVAAHTMIPVVNRAPRNPAVRAEFMCAFARLVPGISHPPVFVPEWTAIERAHRDLSRAPDALCSLIGTVVRHTLDRPRSLPRLDEAAG